VLGACDVVLGIWVVVAVVCTVVFAFDVVISPEHLVTVKSN